MGLSGGIDAIRALNRASRKSKAYRAERSARRKELRHGHDYSLAGETHACVRCDGVFDVNELLRDRGEWTCEACNFVFEADDQLARASQPTAMVTAAGAALIAIAVLQVSILFTESLLFAGFWALCSLTVTGLVATWAEGLRRARVRHLGLYAIEAAALTLSVGLSTTALWALIS